MSKSSKQITENINSDSNNNIQDIQSSSDQERKFFSSSNLPQLKRQFSYYQKEDINQLPNQNNRLQTDCSLHQHFLSGSTNRCSLLNHSNFQATSRQSWQQPSQSLLPIKNQSLLGLNQQPSTEFTSRRSIPFSFGNVCNSERNRFRCEDYHQDNHQNTNYSSPSGKSNQNICTNFSQQGFNNCCGGDEQVQKDSTCLCNHQNQNCNNTSTYHDTNIMNINQRGRTSLGVNFNLNSNHRRDSEMSYISNQVFPHAFNSANQQTFGNILSNRNNSIRKNGMIDEIGINHRRSGITAFSNQDGLIAEMRESIEENSSVCSKSQVEDIPRSLQDSVEQSPQQQSQKLEQQQSPQLTFNPKLPSELSKFSLNSSVSQISQQHNYQTNNNKELKVLLEDVLSNLDSKIFVIDSNYDLTYSNSYQLLDQFNNLNKQTQSATNLSCDQLAVSPSLPSSQNIRQFNNKLSPHFKINPPPLETSSCSPPSGSPGNIPSTSRLEISPPHFERKSHPSFLGSPQIQTPVISLSEPSLYHEQVSVFFNIQQSGLLISPLKQVPSNQTKSLNLSQSESPSPTQTIVAFLQTPLKKPSRQKGLKPNYNIIFLNLLQSIYVSEYSIKQNNASNIKLNNSKGTTPTHNNNKIITEFSNCNKQFSSLGASQKVINTSIFTLTKRLIQKQQKGLYSQASLRTESQEEGENSQSQVISIIKCSAIDQRYQQLSQCDIKLISFHSQGIQKIIITFSDSGEKYQSLNKSIETNIFQTVSHELGTYSNFISTFVQAALIDSSIPSWIKKNYFKFLDSNVFMLNQVVMDIRSFHEYKNSALKITWKKINLPDMLASICKHFKKLAKLKKISFQCDFIEIPPMIYADELKLQSILVNLLSNAFKFTRTGGTVVVSVSLQKEDDIIKVCVSDTGIGMNTEEKQHLQELLNGITLNNKVSVNSSGFGFGITISQILVKMISKGYSSENSPKQKASINQNVNGIQFSSNENEGSQFWFCINASAMKTKIQKLNQLTVSSLNNKLQSEATHMAQSDDQIINNSFKKDYTNTNKQQSNQKRSVFFSNQSSIGMNNPPISKIMEKFVVLSNHEILEIEDNSVSNNRSLLLISEGTIKVFPKDIAQSMFSYEAPKAKLQKKATTSFMFFSETNLKQDVQIPQNNLSNKILGTMQDIKGAKQQEIGNITKSFIFTNKKKKNKSFKRQESSKESEGCIIHEEDHIEEQFVSISEGVIQNYIPKSTYHNFFEANKILIVDDEPMNVKGLQILLKLRAGLSEKYILTASNGQEAVEVFKKNTQQINQIKLIFMDINMPLKDGIQATKEIRAIEKQRALPSSVICACTSWTDIQTQIRCGNCGMDNFYTKPISMEILMGALTKYYFTQQK